MQNTVIQNAAVEEPNNLSPNTIITTSPQGLHEESNDGSKPAFFLALIGGIIGILTALSIFIMLFILKITASGLEAITDRTTLILQGIVLPFYILIASVWIIFAAIWMKHEETLKKGAITTLIASLLSANLIALIGGIVGLIKSNKQITPDMTQQVVGQIQTLQSQ